MCKISSSPGKPDGQKKQVWNTYTTVSSVSSSSLLGGLVDLDVLDDQVASVEALSIGVGLSVP